MHTPWLINMFLLAYDMITIVICFVSTFKGIIVLVINISHVQLTIHYAITSSFSLTLDPALTRALTTSIFPC